MVSIKLHEQGRKGAFQGRTVFSNAFFANLHIAMALLFICSRHNHTIITLIAPHGSFTWSEASFTPLLISKNVSRR
jgi:hypothetical protein